MAKITVIWLNIKLFPLKVYRKLISPLLGPHCRFYPTCSEYATTAIKRYNFITASLLILIRLLKCHPLHPGGYDPVPKKVDVKRKIKFKHQE